MSRFRLTFEAIIKVLKRHGFKHVRQKGSHRTFEGFVGGERRLVQIAMHSPKACPKPKTQKSIIRQSGLSRQPFKKER